MDVKNMSTDTKALRTSIKRAKLFAVQHLTRRIKMLRNKKGTEQQVDKNTRKAARFEEELECIKDLDVNTVVRAIQNTDMGAVTVDIQQRALARLISSKPIQDHLSQPKTSSSKTKSSVNDSTGSSKCLPTQENLTDNSPLPTCSTNDTNSVTSNSDIELETITSSFFVDSLSTMKKHEQNVTRPKGKCEKPQNENSVNSKSKSCKSQKERKKSSNRMGQRARQRLWKEQYGNKAKHIKSIGQKRNPKSQKTKKKLKTNENLRPKLKEKTEKGSQRKGHLVEQTTSHPSWEASKRRKLQQNISQTTFQGQKITFDDSD